jgi:hypothetical protein
MFTKFAASILFAALSLCAGAVHAQDKDMCSQYPFGSKQRTDCQFSPEAAREAGENVKARIEENRAAGKPLCSGYNPMKNLGAHERCNQLTEPERLAALKKAGCNKLKLLSPEQNACALEVSKKFFD